MTALHSAEFGAETYEGAASSPAPTRRVSNGLLAIFSGPAVPLAALALPLVVYLPPFYANHVGISLGMVGLIFSVVRLFDIGFDPLLGAVMDRTRTRFGQFKPWMAVSVPILMLASYLLFMPMRGAGAGYLAGALTLLYVGYSIASLGHLAWGAVLTGDYHGRSRVYGWLQGASVGGMVLVLVLPIIAAKTMRNGDLAGVYSMGWFVILLMPLTTLLALWRSPEAVAAKPIPASFGRYLKVVRRPAVVRLLACTLFLALGPGITGALFLFFFRQSRGFSAADGNFLLLIYFVGGLAGAPVWSRLAKAIGKHRALIASCGYYVVMQSLTLVLPKANVLVGIPVMFLAGISFSAGAILLRAMIADACDEARLDLHSDCTGMIYALHNSGMKIGSALGVGITYPLLQYAFGFRPGVQNTPSAIHGLELTFAIFPILFVVMGALTLVGYRLNEARHDQVRAALAERDAALTAAAG